MMKLKTYEDDLLKKRIQQLKKVLPNLYNAIVIIVLILILKPPLPYLIGIIIIGGLINYVYGNIKIKK